LVKNQNVTTSSTEQRRERLRNALVAAAERAIAERGLGELRARELAAEAGCAVGAIYNAVDDLDELIMLANMRTLAKLEAGLAAALDSGNDGAHDADSAIARMVKLALAYLAFAAADTPRWRALFDHRMPGRPVPDWYRNEQQKLFSLVEEPLRVLQPQTSPKRRALLARSLFSAVHGLVVLGLEEKLQTIPLAVLREQMTFIVTTIGRGMGSAE
jgi:AcrR family transcriptional regulator